MGAISAGDNMALAVLSRDPGDDTVLVGGAR